ncbi:helix-turn-helix domain-containing protein [Veronia pacifica]|nr:helix-turn-helix domain-containing protein [Veronia pacifica]
MPSRMPDLNASFSMALLGKAIRAGRTARGWKQDELAARIGVSKKTIMKIEGGDANVTFIHIIKLLDILGLHLTLAHTFNAEGSVRSTDSVEEQDGWFE